MKWPIGLMFSIIVLVVALWNRGFISKENFQPSPDKKKTFKTKAHPKNQPTPPKTPPKLLENQKTPSQKEAKQTYSQGSPSFPNPKHVAIADKEGNLYPTTLVVDGEYVVAYGDLIVGESRYLEDYRSGDKTLKVPSPELWPKGRIPYRLHEDIPESQREVIKRVSENLKKETGVRLTSALPEDKFYVFFKPGNENCYAQVGFLGQVSTVVLSPQCGFEAIYHEVFHVLGFFHEQNRFDRDEFVRVLWENISEENWPQFEKFPKESFPPPLRETTFNFDSFMLYRPTSFSESTDYSMVNLYGEPYEVRTLPSPADFQRVKLLYQDEIGD